MNSERENFYLLDGEIPTIDSLDLLMANSAFLWGKSVFTTGSLSGGGISFYEEHLKRLENSLQWLWEKESFDSILNFWNRSWSRLDKNHFSKGEWRFRFTIFEDMNKKLHSVLSLNPFIRGELSSVKVDLCPVPVSFRNRIENLKLGSYLDTFREGDRQNGIPLFYNISGRVLETPISNIFFYRLKNNKEEFIYPNEKGEMLLGIGIRHGLEGLNLVESHIDKDEINKFSQAFLINSLRGPQPVISLNGYRLEVSDELTERVTHLFNHNLKKSQRRLWPLESN
jgi:branched-subunit amino acid aminotransferase/4-amino-4-deoxychorismate lyase